MQTLLRFGFVACLVLLWSGPVLALEEVTPLTMLQSTTSAGDGGILDVEHYASVTLKITISATATVTFKTSVDGVAPYSDLGCILLGDTTGVPVTSATATGEYQCNIAASLKVQTPISANTGTVVVLARASTASPSSPSSS